MNGVIEDSSSDGNLVFLISQPRSGSTLLQRMLSRHPEIHSRSETWIMLRSLFGFDQAVTGTIAPYNARIEHQAMRDFVEDLPGGKADYFRACRRMYGELYRAALEKSGCAIFLDKTPRYYEIIPDLLKVFPEAKVILLFRNPLAVFRSVWRTFGAGQWSQMQQFRRDLMEAPTKLVTARDKGGPQVFSLRYEDLVRRPSDSLDDLCEFLGLVKHTCMLDHGTDGLERWTLGDPQTIYERKGADPDHADRWVADLANPQFWRACSEYLDILGSALTGRMGYDYESLRSQLHMARPGWWRRRMTVSLDCLMEEETMRPDRNFGRRVKCELASRAWGVDR
ncbi:MAG: sulfotransferase [Opitutaceae bacterium]